MDMFDLLLKNQLRTLEVLERSSKAVMKLNKELKKTNVRASKIGFWSAIGLLGAGLLIAVQEEKLQKLEKKYAKLEADFKEHIDENDESKSLDSDDWEDWDDVEKEDA